MRKLYFIIFCTCATAAIELASAPIKSILGAHHNLIGASQPYLSELEYIESTGNQWIDSGITVDDPNKLKLSITSNVIVPIGFTHQNDASGTWLCSHFVTTTSKGRIYYKNYTKVLNFNSSDSVVERLYDWAKGYSEDGNPIVSFKAEIGSDSITDMPWLIGATYDFYYKRVHFGATTLRNWKLYAVKIWLNGILVRDLIPVIDFKGIACMYDRVTDEFLYNAGSGSFVPGPEI